MVVKVKMELVSFDCGLIDVINVVEVVMKVEFVDICWSFFEFDVID